ncbi:MAG: hypothetical protein IPO21_05850 [Bacteroidales bacterium]|nr:hypothetical protein [Bacteroidales bacterium]
MDNSNIEQNNFNYISPEYLEEMTESDSKIIKELIQLFKNQTPDFISEMTRCIQQNNFFEFKRIVHKARSAVMVIGINELVERLLELESDELTEKDSFRLLEFIPYFSQVVNISIKELDYYLESLN